MRMLRYRIKDATLVPIDQNMTLVSLRSYLYSCLLLISFTQIHVHDCDGGWSAGQHIRLRVFFNGRVFESHALTILTAPPSVSCLSSNQGGLTLAARVRGDWTQALNTYATDEQSRLGFTNDKTKAPGPLVQVMLDGAYGGSSVDLGDYESVLLIAGGSGATFTLGLLDDIVGRCIKLGRRGGEKTRRIEFAWCIRSFGKCPGRYRMNALRSDTIPPGCIEWFSPMLMEIANTVAGTSLDLHVSIYVTCLCHPEAVPPIPNSEVGTYRPSVGKILKELVTPHSAIADDDSKELNCKLAWAGLGGGVAVCASGPEALLRETQNAVSKMGLTRGLELGGIGLHTELFAL